MAEGCPSPAFWPRATTYLRIVHHFTMQQAHRQRARRPAHRREHLVVAEVYVLNMPITKVIPINMRILTPRSEHRAESLLVLVDIPQLARLFSEYAAIPPTARDVPARRSVPWRIN